MAKKIFSSQNVIERPYSYEDTSMVFLDKKISPKTMMVLFPAEGNATSVRRYDFSKHYQVGCDEVVYAMQCTIENLIKESVKSKKLALSTITNYCTSGISRFIPFCQLVSMGLQRDLTLNDINSDLMERYIAYLGASGLGLTAQKSYYSSIKSVLISMAKSGMLNEQQRRIFPRNPFPNSNRSSSGQKPLSSLELKQVSRALAKELIRIRRETGPLNSYDLSVCMLAICVRTGINPTPLLELPEDCLQPHPLQLNRKLLVSFKRRGNATHITSIRHSEDISLFSTVMMDVAAIIDIVRKRNSELRGRMVSSRLWVTVSMRVTTGQEILLQYPHVVNSIKKFTSNNKLLNDDGKPLILNMSRLRKSYINRMWELSGQDPIATAAMGNHSLTVSNNHYLEAPPEAEKNFSLLGEVRVKELLGGVSIIPAKNTPVAKCKDSLYGHRAPRNGQHCTDFLACFRCKSFVVTEDDLYRLFSLYWLLVLERNTVGAKRWGKYYAHVIRIIDNDIAPKFNSGTISYVRGKAKTTPHPSWKSNELLEGFIT